MLLTLTWKRVFHLSGSEVISVGNECFPLILSAEWTLLHKVFLFLLLSPQRHSTEDRCHCFQVTAANSQLPGPLLCRHRAGHLTYKMPLNAFPLRYCVMCG